ncbi:hypothetical protein F4782DRAFT_478340 [Xylaria castorea]|nr:hypothetical protein F4782DRAFT_478340 [Xylaria castorea]
MCARFLVARDHVLPLCRGTDVLVRIIHAERVCGLFDGGHECALEGTKLCVIMLVCPAHRGKAQDEGSFQFSSPGAFPPSTYIPGGTGSREAGQYRNCLILLGVPREFQTRDFCRHLRWNHRRAPSQKSRPYYESICSGDRNTKCHHLRSSPTPHASNATTDYTETQLVKLGVNSIPCCTCTDRCSRVVFLSLIGSGPRRSTVTPPGSLDALDTASWPTE